MRIEKHVLNDALRTLGKAVYQTSPVELYRSVRFAGVPGCVKSTAVILFLYLKSSKNPDIRSSLNRHGILCSTHLPKRSRSTRRYGLISPTWHSTAVSDWMDTGLNYGPDGTTKPTSAPGTEVMQPYCIQVIPGVEHSLPVFNQTNRKEKLWNVQCVARKPTS